MRNDQQLQKAFAETDRKCNVSVKERDWNRYLDPENRKTDSAAFTCVPYFVGENWNERIQDSTSRREEKRRVFTLCCVCVLRISSFSHSSKMKDERRKMKDERWRLNLKDISCLFGLWPVELLFGQLINNHPIIHDSMRLSQLRLGLGGNSIYNY